MKRSFSLTAAFVSLALLAFFAASTAGAGAASPISVKPVCTVGPIHCMSVLRTDIPVVKRRRSPRVPGRHQVPAGRGVLLRGRPPAGGGG